MAQKLSRKEQEAREMLCLPLDIDRKEDILAAADELHDLVGYFKLNFAFTNYGAEIIEEMKKRGCKIFLDLKFHDIPHTVAGHAKAAARMGIDMFTVHASGGYEMMHAALTAANEEAEKNNSTRPKILAVTILTSLDRKAMNEELGIGGDVEGSVLRLAKLAEQAGLDGVVCSAADLYAIRGKLPKEFMYVTPGVKGVSTAVGSDQKRVFSPGNAVKDGSSLLVVGRAILDAPDRRKAALEILQDMAKNL